MNDPQLCPRCGTVKPPSAWSPSQRGKRGRWCRTCQRLRARRDYQRPQVKARYRCYNQRPDVREKRRRYYRKPRRMTVRRRLQLARGSARYRLKRTTDPQRQQQLHHLIASYDRELLRQEQGRIRA